MLWPEPRTIASPRSQITPLQSWLWRALWAQPRRITRRTSASHEPAAEATLWKRVNVDEETHISRIAGSGNDYPSRVAFLSTMVWQAPSWERAQALGQH